jgi:hypothetical protein
MQNWHRCEASERKGRWWKEKQQMQCQETFLTNATMKVGDRELRDEGGHEQKEATHGERESRKTEREK